MIFFLLHIPIQYSLVYASLERFYRPYVEPRYQQVPTINNIEGGYELRQGKKIRFPTHSAQGDPYRCLFQMTHCVKF